MQYPLQPLVRYVFNQLRPVQLFNLNKQENARLWNEIDEALHNMPAYILEFICSANSSKKIRNLVQSCQLAAIVTANQVHRYTQTIASWPLEEAARQEQLALYLDLRDRLITNLSVLQQFPQYLNKEQQLPDHLNAEQKEVIRKKISCFATTWKGKIDRSLIEIILTPIEKFIEPDALHNMTYHQLHYQEIFFTKLMNLPVAGHKDAERTMIHTLMTLNFNDKSFIAYAIDKLIPPPSTKGPIGDLLQYCIALNNLTKLTPISGIALYPSQPTCFSSIADNIQQQIQLIEKYNLA
ncbi:MAG: hypothetical protein NVSMB7_16940 [Chitinophagaceae bacterium]